MKAISLWQPWASLLAVGSKQWETRSWSTSYRGPLLIHAAKRVNVGESKQLLAMPEFQAAAHALVDFPFHLPLGAIVGCVNLVDCVSTNKVDRGALHATREWLPGRTWTEYDLGNYEFGRFAWICENPVMFEVPIEYKGSQGFFDVPEGDLLRAGLALTANIKVPVQ